MVRVRVMMGFGESKGDGGVWLEYGESKGDGGVW